VKKGELLVELMAADDVAKLDALKATAELARINAERDKKLLGSPSISQQTLDNDAWT